MTGSPEPAAPIVLRCDDPVPRCYSDIAAAGIVFTMRLLLSLSCRVLDMPVLIDSDHSRRGIARRLKCLTKKALRAYGITACRQQEINRLPSGVDARYRYFDSPPTFVYVSSSGMTCWSASGTAGSACSTPVHRPEPSGTRRYGASAVLVPA
jgi:hypothetical protein